MSFADAEADARVRLTESLSLLNHLRSTAPPNLTPLDDVQKAQRGLWLVSLYAAFERGANAVVEAALNEISSHNVKSIDCKPPIHSILHMPRIQSIKDCTNTKMLDSSVRLFDAAFGNELISVIDNPLAKYLQNVDGNTLIWICTLFGTPKYSFISTNKTRLGALRERRNAVAHGREAASEVGERYNLEELGDLYRTVDEELARFTMHMNTYCSGKHYVRLTA